MNHYYVSLKGKDSWSGLIPEPNASQTDGPFASVIAARNCIRHRLQPPASPTECWRPQGITGEITVEIRGGIYPLTEPMQFGVEDSAPVHYTASQGEEVIFDGGEKLVGWREGEANGHRCWIAELPEGERGEWYFQSLFVNGRRASRPRLPKSDWYWIKEVPGKGLAAAFHEGSDCFIAHPGDLKAWKNLTDVEIVVMHLWNDEHLPIVSLNEETGLVKSSRRSIFCLRDDMQEDLPPRFAKYYVQNVFEALSEPGEWYLDRVQGRVYYIPFVEERIEATEIFAPRLTQLLKITGEVEKQRWVQNLRFSGLTFRHTEAVLPPGGWDRIACTDLEGTRHWPNEGDYASAPQAAFNIPGVIQFEGARGCSLERCTIKKVGWYGVEIGSGCSAIRIVGNEMVDLGAGGVKLNGSEVGEPLGGRSGNHLITDNHIHHGGRVFHQAVGILLQTTFGNLVAHNHIHDLFYTGISCGWSWGFMETVSRDNRIEKNHIHHLGFGWLNDMGGIYTLGVQPGTVIRENLIHDIKSANYGGWGIYLDEGSSHVIVESNITYDTETEGFFQHIGRENIVRNNIFAAGGSAQVSLGKTVLGYRGFTFLNNIVVSEGGALFARGYASDLLSPGYWSDYNLLWSTGGAIFHKNGSKEGDQLTMATLQRVGMERHSIVQEPGFANFEGRDFTLLPESPAIAMGFQPIEMGDVGVRVGTAATAVKR